jgi:hypothetical protein
MQALDVQQAMCSTLKQNKLLRLTIYINHSGAYHLDVKTRIRGERARRGGEKEREGEKEKREREEEKVT